MLLLHAPHHVGHLELVVETLLHLREGERRRALFSAGLGTETLGLICIKSDIAESDLIKSLRGDHFALDCFNTVFWDSALPCHMEHPSQLYVQSRL